ncbi:hypothetical protein [Salinispora arenicola]|uniref:hypothetical protein n=1 Tax=Salinispora arenicola TaxID=168697 RepID=UPI001E356D6F|nr:hypothetical protein [Salinispora arenicola]
MEARAPQHHEVGDLNGQPGRGVGGGRELLTAPDRPLGYLVALLDAALIGEHEPPHPARRHDEHRQAAEAARRRDVVDRAAATATARDATRAERAVREQARQAERAGPGRGRHAALAAARAAARSDHATARTIAGEVDDWPDVAQPGVGADTYFFYIPAWIFSRLRSWRRCQGITFGID